MNFPMMQKARIGCVEMMLFVMHGAPGDHIPSLLSSRPGQPSRGSPRKGAHQDGMTSGLAWNTKQARVFPSLAEFCDVYWPWWIPIVPGHLRPAELLHADAHTLLPQQRRAPQPLGASLSVWAARSCAHTKRAAVFFKRPAREPGIRGTKWSHSPRTVCIKNIFTSLVRSASYREWEHPGCPGGEDEDEVKEDIGRSWGVSATWKLS